MQLLNQGQENEPFAVRNGWSVFVVTSEDEPYIRLLFGHSWLERLDRLTVETIEKTTSSKSSSGVVSSPAVEEKLKRVLSADQDASLCAEKSPGTTISYEKFCAIA